VPRSAIGLKSIALAAGSVGGIQNEGALHVGESAAKLGGARYVALKAAQRVSDECPVRGLP
jgi:hypothetical protein